MTRQTYDQAPRLTKLATAHISKGAGWVFAESNWVYIKNLEFV